MLQVLHNDAFSQLSLIQNMNNETLQIIDDDLLVYDTISFNPFEPEDEELVDAWTKALKKYFRIGEEDKLIEWRENMVARSIEEFKNFLQQGKENA